MKVTNAQFSTSRETEDALDFVYPPVRYVAVQNVAMVAMRNEENSTQRS